MRTFDWVSAVSAERLQQLRQSRAEVGSSAAVTPFVVVPGNNLHKLALVPEDLGEVGSENAAVRIVDDVARNDWVFGVAKDPLDLIFI